MDEREEAWGRLHEATPGRWSVGPPSYNPGERRWSISAVGPHRGRGRLPVFVNGFGQDELEAVRDLDARLRGERSDGPRSSTNSAPVCAWPTSTEPRLGPGVSWTGRSQRPRSSA